MSSDIPQKECPECGLTKPVAQFPKNSGRPDGCGYYCKDCYAKRYRAHRERKAAAEGRTIRERRVLPPGLIAYLTRAQLLRPLTPDESRFERRVIEVMFDRHCA